MQAVVWGPCYPVEVALSPYSLCHGTGWDLSSWLSQSMTMQKFPWLGFIAWLMHAKKSYKIYGGIVVSFRSYLQESLREGVYLSLCPYPIIECKILWRLQHPPPIKSVVHSNGAITPFLLSPSFQLHSNLFRFDIWLSYAIQGNISHRKACSSWDNPF